MVIYVINSITVLKKYHILNLNIKNLSPAAVQMVEAYKETHGIATNTKAVTLMLEDHAKINRLTMHRNAAVEDYQQIRNRYRSLVGHCKQIRAHIDHLED